MAVFGRTEERIARIQEGYISQATSSWLESLERSLTQMKDYQVHGVPFFIVNLGLIFF